MGAFPGTPFPFQTPTPGLSLTGAYPPIYLAQQTLSANAVAFPTIANLPPFNGLWVFINVSGYGGTDVVSLRFNGDSGTNYWDRTLTVAAGGVVVVDTNTVSTTLIRMGLPINKGRQVFAQIGNLATKSKVVQVMNQFGSGAAGTAATITIGTTGEWVNTTAQITQIDCLTAGGLNILAGSSITVYGVP